MISDELKEDIKNNLMKEFDFDKVQDKKVKSKVLVSKETQTSEIKVIKHHRRTETMTSPQLEIVEITEDDDIEKKRLELLRIMKANEFLTKPVDSVETPEVDIMDA